MRLCCDSSPHDSARSTLQPFNPTQPNPTQVLLLFAVNVELVAASEAYAAASAAAPLDAPAALPPLASLALEALTAPIGKCAGRPSTLPRTAALCLRHLCRSAAPLRPPGRTRLAYVAAAAADGDGGRRILFSLAAGVLGGVGLLSCVLHPRLGRWGRHPLALSLAVRPRAPPRQPAASAFAASSHHRTGTLCAGDAPA